MKNRSLQAFTLAELLVSLSVLGIVAAFAIPKVLLSVSDQSTKAAGREAYAMKNGAPQLPLILSDEAQRTLLLNDSSIRSDFNYAEMGKGYEG